MAVAFLAALVVALGQPDPALDWHWQLWKKTYGKEYRHEVGVFGVGGGVGGWRCLGVLAWWVLLRRDHPLRRAAGRGAAGASKPRGVPGTARWGLPTTFRGVKGDEMAAGAVAAQREAAFDCRKRKGTGA